MLILKPKSFSNQSGSSLEAQAQTSEQRQAKKRESDKKRKEKDVEILGDNINEQLSKKMMRGNEGLNVLLNMKIPKKIPENKADKSLHASRKD